ncbi:hypothetical protein AHAS_Ahas02G0129300 [Arachis hypogaea]
MSVMGPPWSQAHIPKDAVPQPRVSRTGRVSGSVGGRATGSGALICAGRYWPLIVGANERRWKRYRDRLKVVADSFRLLDI